MPERQPSPWRRTGPTGTRVRLVVVSTRRGREALERWGAYPRAHLEFVAVVLAAYRVARWQDWLAPVVRATAGHRRSLYELSATLTVGVFAFVLVPAAVVFALAPGVRLAALLRHHRDELRHHTVATARIALLTVVALTAAIALDTGNESNLFARYAAAGLMVVTLLGALRLVALYGNLLRVDAADQTSSPVLQQLRPVPIPEGSPRPTATRS